jgi:hypothetical protein
MATGNSRDAMIELIAYELGNRTDLQANGTILRAINDAIQIYQKERFRFNELQPLTPFTFNTEQNRYIYDAAYDARIGLLYKIDHLNFLLGNVNSRMERVFPENIYLAVQPNQQAGPPSSWAWDGNSIVIYPKAPAQVFPITVLGYLAVAGPTSGSDATNPWMNEAERLIRARAKYEIALNYTRNKDMIAMMSPDNGSGGATERYYNELKSEANKIRGTSRVRPMQF